MPRKREKPASEVRALRARVSRQDETIEWLQRRRDEDVARLEARIKELGDCSQTESVAYLRGAVTGLEDQLKQARLLYEPRTENLDALRYSLNKTIEALVQLVGVIDAAVTARRLHAIDKHTPKEGT